MNVMRCRDCGHQLNVDARGCPRCALNFDAEKMIRQIILRRLLPLGAALAFLLTIVAFYLAHKHKI